VGRDRRWDYLYDRQRMPVKEVILERFSEEVAAELAGWPASVVWESEVERERHAAALASPASEAVVRFALALARLDLGRDLEAYERLLATGGDAWSSPGESAVGGLLVRFVAERCLDLKERAEGARLTRADLVRAVDLVERRLFGR
jgi:hypothetical protein